MSEPPNVPTSVEPHGAMGAARRKRPPVRRSVAILVVGAMVLVNFILVLGDVRRKRTAVSQAEWYAGELTRRMSEGTMLPLNLKIDVPPEHVSEGQTAPSLDTPDGTEEKIGQLIKIKSNKDEPEKAFVAVKYENYWFWIDKRDFASKRVFAFLMILFSLTETGGKEGLPLVTIPAS
jgi:hypothetical protein